MVDQVIMDRFNNVQDKGQKLLTQHVRRNEAAEWVEDGPFGEWRTQSLTLLQVVFGPDHVYTQDFDKFTSFDRSREIAGLRHVQAGIGALNAASEDYARGYTWTFKEIVHADVFDDFLEMASYLIDDGGFKDAAAVLAGGTLEEHLRQLCQKHGVSTTTVQGRPKQASVMNDDLKNLPVYQQPLWRKVQSWLDIRNDAAHAKYGNYAQTDVEQMIDGIRDFIDRYPA